MDEQLLYAATAALARGRLKVTCAESCTGGLLAAAFTELPGSSAWFETGFVTYSNEAKQRLLGVSAESLRREGAVSESVAREMASGARAAAQADFALSITGIAGPGGGSADKPVGTVCFGLAGPGGVSARTAHFHGTRGEIRRKSAAFALVWLAQALADADR
ncbi:Uncharacterized protein (competence- and mitomycin-induced) [Kingella potus]|uniref:Uncharacterized protein (Competence- and mitomycin-induced) n=1 Tax=Kingella potus TaxID=265175 RepID=A0A377R3C2_9NEIS|nr:CinA family protein [Kingella potus]STR02472.1 Uncharacterized protein (competence- and mitomycin-induced) [Kingella potus]